MGIKLADTLEPMADFPSAYAKDIAFDDGDTLQKKLDTGSLGGGGVGYKQLSQAEYDALTDDEKLDGREYRTYDTGHIYKLGIEYGKDGVQISDVVSEDSTWSSKKINDFLVDKQDFVIYNSIEEFNKKKGTSLTVVSGIDNMKDIVNAMSNGEMLIITISYASDSDVYFGLNASTGWTKIFTFIKANGLCDVECRTTSPSTFKRVLNVDGVIGDWQELATMNKVGDNIIVTPHTQIGATYTITPNDLNRIDIDVAKSGYTCIGILSLQDNHGSYTQFRGWYVENNKVVVHVISGETYSDYVILASLLYKKN